MGDQGTVFHIQRFSTSDGPGIRTVVFLKGCPLDCAWCHNPESKSAGQELFYKAELCIHCGACSRVCAGSAHTRHGGLHRFCREKCLQCGKCPEVCPTRALEQVGEEKTARQILEAVLPDRPFYEESGGGITLSGGEPLMQFDFSLAVLKLAKEHGLHTAIETSGFSGKDLTALQKFTDLWLYDIKLFPEEAHKTFTGVSNKRILDNLHALNRMGAKIILRCPIIPGVNLTEEHFTQLARLSNALDRVVAVHLEPYHPLGISKAQQLDQIQSYQNPKFLAPAALEPFAQILRKKTQKPVVIL